QKSRQLILRSRRISATQNSNKSSVSCHEGDSASVHCELNTLDRCHALIPVVREEAVCSRRVRTFLDEDICRLAHEFVCGMLEGFHPVLTINPGITPPL